MKDMLQKFQEEESGQGLSEYSLILALLSIGLILILVFFRNATGNVFRTIRDVLASPE
jgi:pilus assembly protein Flp/PilA